MIDCHPTQITPPEANPDAPLCMHVATLDYDKDLIVERTNRFIKEHTT